MFFLAKFKIEESNNVLQLKYKINIKANDVQIYIFKLHRLEYVER